MERLARKPEPNECASTGIQPQRVRDSRRGKLLSNLLAIPNWDSYSKLSLSRSIQGIYSVYDVGPLRRFATSKVSIGLTNAIATDRVRPCPRWRNHKRNLVEKEGREEARKRTEDKRHATLPCLSIDRKRRRNRER